MSQFPIQKSPKPLPSLPSKSNMESIENIVESDPTGRFHRYDIALGRGSFKQVYKAFDNETGIEVAWNQLNVDSEESASRFLAEITLLQGLDHPNIIKLLHAWSTEEKLFFITELMTSGTLSSYLRRSFKSLIPRAVVVGWCRQILEGLNYLHSHTPPIIHRDLKCENILVNGNQGVLKIADLGLATVKSENVLSSVIGTPAWMAPELFEEEGFTEKVDIFAFGMSLIEILTKEFPYSEASSQAQIFRKITTGVLPASLAKITDPEAKSFIEACLRQNANDRPSAKELLEHAYLTNLSTPQSTPISLNSNPTPLATPISLNSNPTTPLQLSPKLIATELVSPIPTDHKYDTLETDSHVYHFRDLNPDDEFWDGQKIVRRQTTGDLQLEILNPHASNLITIRLGYRGQEIKFPYTTGQDSPQGVVAEMVKEGLLSDDDLEVVQDAIESLLESWSRRQTPPNSRVHQKTPSTDSTRPIQLSPPPLEDKDREEKLATEKPMERTPSMNNPVDTMERIKQLQIRAADNLANSQPLTGPALSLRELKHLQKSNVFE